ncbi:glycosyltransferase [Acidiphilium sp. PA]|uniref:glycosyltransferase family 2 protein n=1 Tax=Acidiphilium sp. PA TaxID=2871705 RepID=UPI002242DF8C|nr:glycosyltransferase [Acidiphilium sp. PA]MCW8307590.1 glycosyltransferase [Acidiphilium sp. PA]
MRRSSQAATGAEPPILTVAICTHNRGIAVARCLAGLGPPHPAVDVLVVDSGSDGEEAETILRAAMAHGAQHTRLASVGLSAARNAALAAARGQWIAYLDDDATPASDWVTVLLASIAQDPDLAATGGMILPQWQALLPVWWPDSLRAVLTIIDRVAPDACADIDPYAANIAFRRDVLTRFGGFPACLGRRGTLLLSNEETYILRRLRRAHFRVRFNPALVVHHEIARERLRPDWLVRRQYWSGVSEAVMLAALGERRMARAWRMAAHAMVLAPWLLFPRQSTRQISLRCKAAFATGFVRGMLIEASDDMVTV